MVDDAFLRLIEALKSELPGEVRPGSIQEKGHLDFVTELDFRLDAIVRKTISSLFPADQMVSEEEWTPVSDLRQPIWVIDPLDGTSNEIANLPFSAISIALVDKEGIRFGMVMDWRHDEIFYAERGEGAFMNGLPIACSDNKASFLGVSTGFLLSHGDALSKIGTDLKFRLLGSQALHLCYVACGRFCGAVNIESKIWDDIAGALILTEAGGDYKSLVGVDLNQPATWSECKTSSGFAIGKPSSKLRDLLEMFDGNIV